MFDQWKDKHERRGIAMILLLFAGIYNLFMVLNIKFDIWRLLSAIVCFAGAISIVNATADIKKLEQRINKMEEQNQISQD